MDDTTKPVNNPAGAESCFSAGLERLIDGDVTCWGIDDVVAYGRKVAAMGREGCAIVCDNEVNMRVFHTSRDTAKTCASNIRMRSNI